MKLVLLFYSKLVSLPKYRYIATNKYNQKGNKVIEDMKVVVRKPHAIVNNNNFQYLQLIDANNPHEIFNDYMNKNNLDYGKLIAIAGKNYNREVLLRITDLAVKTRL